MVQVRTSELNDDLFEYIMERGCPVRIKAATDSSKHDQNNRDLPQLFWNFALELSGNNC